VCITRVLKNSFLKEGDSPNAKDNDLTESRLDPALKGWDCGEGQFNDPKTQGDLYGLDFQKDWACSGRISYRLY
jgi:hypothetical protein